MARNGIHRFTKTKRPVSGASKNIPLKLGDQLIDRDLRVAQYVPQGAESDGRVQRDSQRLAVRIRWMTKAYVTTFLPHADVTKFAEGAKLGRRPKLRESLASSSDDYTADQNVGGVWNLLAGFLHVF